MDWLKHAKIGDHVVALTTRRAKSGFLCIQKGKIYTISGMYVFPSQSAKLSKHYGKVVLTLQEHDHYRMFFGTDIPMGPLAEWFKPVKTLPTEISTLLNVKIPQEKEKIMQIVS